VLSPTTSLQLYPALLPLLHGKYVSVENTNKTTVVLCYACAIRDADSCPCFVWAMAGALCLTRNHAPNPPDTECVTRSQIQFLKNNFVLNTPFAEADSFVEGNEHELASPGQCLSAESQRVEKRQLLSKPPCPV